jgi:hypothetical protein
MSDFYGFISGIPFESKICPFKILSARFQEDINHGYEPQSKLWKLYRSKLRGIIPSAARDCSTYQYRRAAHTVLEFHNKKSLNNLKSLSHAHMISLYLFTSLTPSHNF